jgi:hypothetical protein
MNRAEEVWFFAICAAFNAYCQMCHVALLSPRYSWEDESMVDEVREGLD